MHFQSLADIGIAPFRDPSLAGAEITLAPSDKEQVNAVIDLTGTQTGLVYHPTLIVTPTCGGMRTTYYQYQVPVTIAVRPGPQEPSCSASFRSRDRAADAAP